MVFCVNLLILYYIILYSCYIFHVSLFSIIIIVFIIGLICLFRYDATFKFAASIIDCFDPGDGIA